MGTIKFPAQLVDFAKQFEATRAQVNSLIAGMNHQQFNQRPGDGGWSVAECIDHLNLTGKDYTAQIERGIEKAKAHDYKYRGPYKYSWIGKKFIANVEPPDN